VSRAEAHVAAQPEKTGVPDPRTELFFRKATQSVTTTGGTLWRELPRSI
jgi:hypothetical protein